MVFFNKKYIPPKIGDVMTKRVFAIWPKKIGNKTVWLSFYEAVFVYGEISIKTEAQVLIVKNWHKISDTV